MNRRGLIQSGLSLTAVTLLPTPAMAASEEMHAAIKTMFGQMKLETKHVSLSIPPIAENGFSVPLEVNVDSPMLETDYIKRIAIFSERNPVPLIAAFDFTPQSGRAFISTRVRLGGTQTITAIAQNSDGHLYAGHAKAVVTLAACVVL